MDRLAGRPIDADLSCPHVFAVHYSLMRRLHQGATGGAPPRARRKVASCFSDVAILADHWREGLAPSL